MHEDPAAIGAGWIGHGTICQPSQKPALRVPASPAGASCKPVIVNAAVPGTSLTYCQGTGVPPHDRAAAQPQLQGPAIGRTMVEGAPAAGCAGEGAGAVLAAAGEGPTGMWLRPSGMAT